MFNSGGSLTSSAAGYGIGPNAPKPEGYHRPQVIRQSRKNRPDPRAYGEWVYSDADEGWISQADFDAIAVEPVGSSKPVESEKIPMMAPFEVTASRIADFGAQFRGSLGWGVARAALGGAGGYSRAFW